MILIDFLNFEINLVCKIFEFYYYNLLITMIYRVIVSLFLFKYYFIHVHHYECMWSDFKQYNSVKSALDFKIFLNFNAFL